MRQWYSFFFRGGAFGRVRRGWWSSLAEAALAALLSLSGVVFLVVVVAQTFSENPDSLTSDSGYYLSLQLLVAIVLVVVGIWRVTRLLWTASVSEERRSAIVKQAVDQAGEIELLRELRQRRDDLPTIPTDLYPPHQGIWKRYRLVPSPRNVWGLVIASVFSIVFVALTTLLLVTASRSLPAAMSARFDQVDWFAPALAIPIGLAAAFAIYQFFRQFLKLTGIGPTTLEIDQYPVISGEEYEVTLTQTGRVRLQLLDVELVCDEEATFNEGTDVRTERRTVYSQRLIRKRGIPLSPGVPWRTDFQLIIPAQAMHSFRSGSNRVQWKIIVIAKAQNWPRLRRHFGFTVHPPS